jgi:hypothetical protein
LPFPSRMQQASCRLRKMLILNEFPLGRHAACKSAQPHHFMVPMNLTSP